MTPHGSILRVPAPRKDEPPPPTEKLTPRKAIAEVMEHFVGASGMRNIDVIEASRSLSESAFYRIQRGEAVRDQKLAALAKILELPSRLFVLMLQVDRKRIEQLVDLSEDDKRFVLEVLDRTDIVGGRRSSDS